MKLFKWTAVTFSILVVLLLIPVIILLTIDVNHYKSLIADTVHKQTGRQLNIEGPIEKSFFPWLGVHVGALQFSNAAGFGDTPMAQVQEVQVKIKLLPLFKKEIVVDKLVIHGLKLHLARNAEGVGNWEDFTTPREIPQPPEPAPQAPESPAPDATPTAPISALHIGGIDIRDAALVWDDHQAQARYELSELNVQTDELQLGQPFHTRLAFQFNATEPDLQGKILWSARIDVQPQIQQYRLRDMNLEADLGGALLPIPRLALKLAAQVHSDLENQTASVSDLTLAVLGSELSGSAQAKYILAEPQLDSQLHWRVDDAQTFVSGLQPLLPPEINAALLKDTSVQLQAQLAMDEQTARITDMKVQLGELSLQAALKAEQIVDNPVFNGSLDVAAFNPRPLLLAFLGELPAMADEKALTQVAMNTEFQGTLNSMSLKPLSVQVDDTKLTGSTAVTQFETPAIEFALHVDALDVDRYLPPPPPEPSADQPAGAAPPAPPTKVEVEEEEIPLPVDMLRMLTVNGELTADRLKAKQVELAQLSVAIQAADGVLRADPVQVQLYQGSSTTRLSLDVRQEKPLYKLTEVIKGVEFGPLIKGLMSDDYVAGMTNLQVDISAQGSRVSELKQQLNGTAGFDFSNGVVKYLDLADILVADYAKYLRKALPADDPGKTTAFRILKGTADITNGVVSNKDLYLQSARFEAMGEGNVDLVKETIGYTVNTQIHNPTDKMSQYGLDKLVGVPIPVHFRGTFAEPKYSVDWEGTLRKATKQRIRQEQDKLREQAKQKLKEEKQELKDKTDQKKEQELQKLKDKADQKKEEELRKLKEKLKGLF